MSTAVDFRFRGGQTHSLHVAVGLSAPEARRTPPAVVAEVDRLLDHHTEAGVADQLNQAGVLSSTGQAFHSGIVHHIRVNHRLAPREQRLAARGLLNLTDAAARLGVCTTTLKRWHHEGLIHGEPLNDKGSHYYQIPAVAPHKKTGRPPKRRRDRETSTSTNPGGAV